MRGGRPLTKNKEQKPPIASQLIISKSLRCYSHQNLAWLRITDKNLRKSHNLSKQIQSMQRGEWMERNFKEEQSNKEISELVQYYRYYKSSPLLTNHFYFDFMNTYWSRSKTLYYLKIKKILQIDNNQDEQTLERNISQDEQSRTIQNRSTFYLMPHIITPISKINDDNDTLEKIISSLHKKQNAVKIKSIGDIDKAFKFTYKDQSKTKDRNSQLKTHLKANPSNFVSHFSYKGTTVIKKKKKNHKSLSNEPLHSQQRISKGKKLATTNSCMNIAINENNLNYERRDKNLKNSQKEIKTNKRETSQLNNIIDSKKSHKKIHSTEKSSQGLQKSKSTKKRMETQSNVRAAIDKTKNKIKEQKNLMLKKFIESRQSHTKSIDSTCGQVYKYRK